MNPTSCPNADWSPVESAGANSQLSAVLAGFVFAGIVVLLSDRRRGSTAIWTLGLFCASFMVLGLSSYLFGLVTGDTEPTACKRAWTETVIASGLLGLGAVALISGIAWLLASYLIVGEGEAADQAANKAVMRLALQRLGVIVTLMVYGIIGVVTVLLSVTVYGYLRSWYSTPPRWTIWVLVLYPPAILLLVLIWKTRRARNERRGSVKQGAWKGTTDALFIGAAASLGYSAIGAIYAGWVASTHVEVWQQPSSIWLYTTGAMALFMPAPALVALAYAAPRLTTGVLQTRASRMLSHGLLKLFGERISRGRRRQLRPPEPETLSPVDKQGT